MPNEIIIFLQNPLLSVVSSKQMFPESEVVSYKHRFRTTIIKIHLLIPKYN
jgi:hypothetical protein